MDNQTIENDRNLIEKYKTNIDLVSYLKEQGYEPDRKKFSRNYPVMIDEGTGHRLLITKNAKSGHNMYYNFEDSSDKGTIVQLIAAKHHLDLSRGEDWKVLHKECSAMLGDTYYQSHEQIKPATIPSGTRKEGLVKFFDLKPLTKTDFLEHDRQLTKETIFSPEFTGRIFNKIFIDQLSQTSGHNTVFPIESPQGVIGIMNRSPQWNKIDGSKIDGVWMSNILPETKVKQVIVSEAPIDSMSYHQLFPPKTAGENLHIATAGNLTQDQTVTIQHLINKTSPEKLVIASDNDPSGIRMSINLLGKLLMPDAPNTGVRMHITNTQFTNTLTLEADPRLLPGDASGTALIQKIDQTMNRGLGEEGRATIELITQRPDALQLKVSFQNVRPMLIRARNLTVELRQWENHLLVRRPIEKDFNEDITNQSFRKQVSDKLGITLNSEQLKTLTKTDLSPIVLTPALDPGKVQIEYIQGGISLEFIPRLKEPLIPNTYRGSVLTQEDKANLLTRGELGRRIQTIHPVSKETQTGYLGIDPQTNQLRFVNANRLAEKNLYIGDITPEQLRGVLAGRVVQVDRIRKGRETHTFSVGIQAASGAVIGVRVEPKTNAQGQQTTQEMGKKATPATTTGKSQATPSPTPAQSAPAQTTQAERGPTKTGSATSPKQTNRL